MTRPVPSYGPRPDRDARAARALAAARDAGFGPGTPPAERDAQMAVLLGQGCYLDEIARLFGVCRETVRRRLRRAG